MRSLIYDETAPRAFGGPAYDRIDATAGWLKHLDNLYYLEFIAGHSSATWQERQQAEREIAIAKRKMGWHSKHPNYCAQSAERGAQAIKRKWGR